IAGAEDPALRDRVVQVLRTLGASARSLRRTIQARSDAQDFAETSSPASTQSPQPAGNQPHDDGPEDPGYLWWNGRRPNVPPIPYRLLKCVWGRDAVPVEEVVQGTWGEGDATDTQIKSALYHLNEVLLAAKIPFGYGQRQGQIIKK